MSQPTPSPTPAAEEQSLKMTTEKALGMFARSNHWLMTQLENDAECRCGACYLCAYRHFEQTASELDQFIHPERPEYQDKP